MQASHAMCPHSNMRNAGKSCKRQRAPGRHNPSNCITALCAVWLYTQGAFTQCFLCRQEVQAAENARRAQAQQLHHCLEDKAALQEQLQLAERHLAEAQVAAAAAGQQKDVELGLLASQLKVTDQCNAMSVVLVGLTPVSLEGKPASSGMDCKKA